MLPILAPLLSLGLSYIARLFTSDDDKKTATDSLTRLAQEDKHEELEAEVRRLARRCEELEAQAQEQVPAPPPPSPTPEEPVLDLPELAETSDKAQVKLQKMGVIKGSEKWRNALGLVCVASLGVNYIGVYLVDTLINITNAFIAPLAITPVAALNSDDIITILVGMLGLGGLDIVHKKLK